MLVEGSRRATSARVIVVGNEKGGSGKSTVAMHVAVALMKSGQGVATIDLDTQAKKLYPSYREQAGLGQAVGT